MIRVVLGVFVALHGLVHVLYAGHSRRLFELESQLAWPDGAWALSGLLGDAATRGLAGVLMVLAAAGFVASGAGLIAAQDWWRPVALATAVLSTLSYVLLWDASAQNLDGQGLYAILINVAIAAVVLLGQRIV